MKKILASLIVGFASLAGIVNAAEPCCQAPASIGPSAKSFFGIANHLGLGVGIGTNGISVEAATPLTRFVSVRAGVHFMPNIKYNTDVDAYFTRPGEQYPTSESVELNCGLGRTQGSLIFNIYPLPHGAFFIAAGAYFGGNKLIKINGHTDALKGIGGEIEVGDYNIPVDKNGDVRGGLKVKGFRPYLGLGWGRAIPRHLLNFNIELGAQFEGKPKPYTETGELGDLLDDERSNDFKDVIKYLKVYPTLTFRLTGKIF